MTRELSEVVRRSVLQRTAGTAYARVFRTAHPMVPLHLGLFWPHNQLHAPAKCVYLASVTRFVALL